MELGKAKLLRTGLNALHQAVHPVHGIAWTDGKQVCLTSILHVPGGGGGEVKFGDTNVIGQFEHVFGLFWAPLCCRGSPALLAVQHKKHVTVWQLQLSAQERNKLLCTQTCEMSVSVPLLPQGCVWHPKTDALAVLTKQDASVLFSVRADNRRVKADIRASGDVRCACWTKDGARLVLAVGGALHSFVWNDVNKSLLPCAFCPVFDVGGGVVCAMAPTGETQVAVATELPLDKLCGLNAGMAFEMPARDSSPSSPHHNHHRGDDGGGADSSGRRFLETACSSLAATAGPVDLTQLLARHRRSDPSPLAHLRRRDASLTGEGQDASHLVLVTYERKVTTSRKVSVPGILAPDIVAFDPRGSTVAVASNACGMVLVYRLATAAAPSVQQISLQSSERPKGAVFLSDRLLLLMVGRQRTPGDAVFLPSASTASSSSSSVNTDKYVLRLVVKDLSQSGEGGPSPGRVSPAFLHQAESPPRHGAARRHSTEAVRLGQGIKDLVLPGGAVVGSPGGRRLVEEVVVHGGREAGPVTGQAEVSATSSSSSITTESSDVEPQGSRSPAASSSSTMAATTTTTEKPPPAPVFAMAAVVEAAASRERGLEQLVQNMERLFTRFSDVQQCVAEIRDYAQNGKKLGAVAAAVVPPYPSAHDPPYVNVTCQKRLSENVFTDERRPVLLCEGKLRLSALLDLFDLATVEMLHGPLWIALVADAGGFVPLTFRPQDEVTVRNGRRRTPLPTPGSPETPGPPVPAPSPAPSPGHTADPAATDASA